MCHNPCIKNYPNFETKFLEGWMYVTTQFDYLFIIVVNLNLISY
jgi:hypothetical protein